MYYAFGRQAQKSTEKTYFFGAFYCSFFWLSHQKSLTLNKYIIFGFNAILIPLKQRYIIQPESWAWHAYIALYPYTWRCSLCVR